jgi:hypothetical protein
MIRRRRRTREIPFSLDSFLDVVANVVGIIIRLILVAWVGARTYSSLKPSPRPGPSPGPPAAVTDPLEEQLAQRRRELEQVREQLLKELKRLPPIQEQQQATDRQLAGVRAQRQRLLQERDRPDAPPLDSVAGGRYQPADLCPSLAELDERGKRLREEIAALEKLPPIKRLLRYRVPVSRPVTEQELHFECRAGRVSYVDFPGFRIEVERAFEAGKDQLRQTGRLEGTTPPLGDFQGHYILTVAANDPEGRVEQDLDFEPIAEPHGETAQQALAANSTFRRLVDGAAGRQTVVTFWVYPDSFALFRQLREYVYAHNIEFVAARPLPFGQPIASSTHRGTKSRGQ